VRNVRANARRRAHPVRPHTVPASLGIVTINQCGTLVVGVPCRDGYVVAADSRVTLPGGVFVDGREKLQPLEGSPGIVIAITGVQEFMAKPVEDVDLATWYHVAP
jgi:hypothetical protein